MADVKEIRKRLQVYRYFSLFIVVVMIIAVINIVLIHIHIFVATLAVSVFFSVSIIFQTVVFDSLSDSLGFEKLSIRR